MWFRKVHNIFFEFKYWLVVLSYYKTKIKYRPKTFACFAMHKALPQNVHKVHKNTQPKSEFMVLVDLKALYWVMLFKMNIGNENL